MDPSTLIETALAAGALAGTKDTASSAVKDAYNGLKDLVKRRLAGRPDAELVLAKHETAPETWKAPAIAELVDVEADHDRDLIQAAQALMSLVDEYGSRTGTYAVDARGRKVFRSATTTGRTTSSTLRQVIRTVSMVRGSYSGEQALQRNGYAHKRPFGPKSSASMRICAEDAGSLRLFQEC